MAQSNTAKLARMKSLPSELELVASVSATDIDVAGLESAGFVDIHYNNTLRNSDACGFED